MIKPPPPKKPLEYLTNQNQLLGYLKTHCDLLTRLNEIVQKYLPDPLKPHCIVVNYRNSHLILGSASAAFSTRLRFEIPHLIQYLSKEALLSDLSKIEVIILP